MNFELDSDEVQLRDSLRRLLAERTRIGLDPRQRGDDSLWKALGELGVTALALPEECGGFAQPPIAWLPVLQELGRSLALQPFLPTAVLAGSAIAASASQALRERWLPAIADASAVIGAAADTTGAGCLAREEQGAWALEGSKSAVLYGMQADAVLVSAQAGPEVAWFLVEASGLERTAGALIDDTPVAKVRFRGSRAQRVEGDACRSHGTAAVVAEAWGVAERAYELTVDYVQTRQQFGRAIGSNQAVRHRVAEMRVALEQLRSAAMAGLLALDEGDEAWRERELSRAKLLASRHGTFIAQQAIQLHGGIGMTTEYAVGHCLRRMTVLEMLFGDGPSHAARLGARIVASDDGRARAAA